MEIKAKEVRLVPISELRPSPKNRNKHSDEQIERLKQIIQYQGFRNPIIVSNRSGYMVAGHGRLLAAAKLGMSEVPVIYQDFDNEEQEYASGVSDNAIASWAELDLSGIHLDLPDMAPFDIDLLGIKDFKFEPDPEIANCDEDATPEPPVEAKTKLGELWHLGEHRLLCGDSTVVSEVARLMNGEKADMVFTDPPYNVASDSENFAANVSESMRVLKESNWDKNFDPKSIFSIIEESLSENATIYICTSHYLAGTIWDWMKTWAKHHGYCVWVKPNPMPSLSKRHWTWATELICYATKGKHTFNFPSHGHALSYWEQPKKSEGTHPTQKPVDLCEKAISHSSRGEDLILDLFLGSGTTLVACEKTKRRCYGMEIDPHYCDVILERWAKYTGKDPVREDGVKWSELKSQ